jgi:hypothetical protein
MCGEKIVFCNDGGDGAYCKTTIISPASFHNIIGRDHFRIGAVNLQVQYIEYIFEFAVVITKHQKMFVRNKKYKGINLPFVLGFNQFNTEDKINNLFLLG